MATLPVFRRLSVMLVPEMKLLDSIDIDSLGTGFCTSRALSSPVAQA